MTPKKPRLLLLKVLTKIGCMGFTQKGGADSYGIKSTVAAEILMNLN